MKPDYLLHIQDEHNLLPVSGFLQAVYQIFCEAMAFPGNVEADLILCLPAELQLINKRFRGVDKPTDVISFPHPPNQGENLSGKEMNRYLGEILIDINYIAMETDTQDLNADITQVFIHGLLHLCGFDHLNSIQKRNMQEQESLILSRLRQEG